MVQWRGAVPGFEYPEQVLLCFLQDESIAEEEQILYMDPSTKFGLICPDPWWRD